MKTLLLILVLSCNSLFANEIFTVKKNGNRFELDQCQKNHHRIFNVYINQLDSEIARLLWGVALESSGQTPQLKVSLYKSILSDLVIKRAVVAKMKAELKKISLDEYYGKKSIHNNDKVFNTDEIELEIEKGFGKTIDKAVEANREKHGFKHHLLHEIKVELLKEIVIKLSGNTYRALGNGLVAKFLTGSVLKGVTAGMAEKALVSFGSHVLKGALFWTAVALVTGPLYGARHAPEQDWVDLLEKHPEFILNPEWMKEAGIHDRPWITHCDAITRKTDQMESILSNFVGKEEDDFLSSLSQVNAIDLTPLEEESEFKNYNRIERDALYVHNNKWLIAAAPVWAEK